jgi:hypothetical protein
MLGVLLPLLGIWSTTALAEEATPPDLRGTFHLRMRTATDAKIPVIGTTRVNTTSDMLATIRLQDGRLVQSHQTCFVNAIPTRGIARTILPPAFIRALPIKTYTLVLTQDAEGWRYDADLLPQWVGYHPVLPEAAMPTDPKHPAIYDWDGDGKPGASVLLDIPVFGEFRIYMVQRSHARLTGRIENENKVTGQAIMMELSQRTIGADNVLFRTSPHIAPAPGPRAFELTRVPQGSTCADLLSGASHP